MKIFITLFTFFIFFTIYAQENATHCAKKDAFSNSQMKSNTLTINQIDEAKKYNVHFYSLDLEMASIYGASVLIPGGAAIVIKNLKTFYSSGQKQILKLSTDNITLTSRQLELGVDDITYMYKLSDDIPKAKVRSLSQAIKNNTAPQNKLDDLTDNPRNKVYQEAVIDDIVVKGVDDVWMTISKQVDDLILPNVNQIKNIYSDSKVGYRGSLATGQKYNNGNPLPFDANDFDVDAFIVSDQLAAQIGNKQFRNARDIDEISDLCDDLELLFQSQFSGYRLEPNKPFTFRVWTEAEFQSKVVPYGYKLIQ